MKNSHFPRSRWTWSPGSRSRKADGRCQSPPYSKFDYVEWKTSEISCANWIFFSSHAKKNEEANFCCLIFFKRFGAFFGTVLTGISQSSMGKPDAINLGHGRSTGSTLQNLMRNNRLKAASKKIQDHTPGIKILDSDTVDGRKSC